MPEWAVVADDFTGAMDTGLQFAKADLRTIFDLGGPAAVCDALVLTSNSRSLDAAAARAAAQSAAARAAAFSRRVYKKVDSTLRGNIGPELEALLQATGAQAAVLAPAFPAQGRTTRDGIQFVRGVRVTETEAARDPAAPVAQDCITDLVQRASTLRAAHAALSTVRAGPSDLARLLIRLITSGAQIVVADAETDADLATIAQALSEAGLDRLTAGSAGLAEQLVKGKPGLGPSALPAPSTSAVAIAGSFSQVTAAQVDFAVRRHGARLCRPALPELARPDLALDDAQDALGSGRAWIAYPGHLPAESFDADNLAALKGWLAAVASGCAARFRGVGMILTGGETASVCLAGLGAGAIQILAEVRSGVAGGALLGGPHAGMRIVTKAGGFGGDDALAASIAWLLASAPAGGDAP